MSDEGCNQAAIAVGRFLLFKVLGEIVRTSRTGLREEHLDGIERWPNETASPDTFRPSPRRPSSPDGSSSERVLCAKARNVLTSALLNVEQIVALQGLLSTSGELATAASLSESLPMSFDVAHRAAGCCAAPVRTTGRHH